MHCVVKAETALCVDILIGTNVMFSDLSLQLQFGKGVTNFSAFCNERINSYHILKWKRILFSEKAYFHMKKEVV